MDKQFAALKKEQEKQKLAEEVWFCIFFSLTTLG
jgi:hypothetical protein